MLKRYNRLLVAFHVLTDATLGMVAFLLAYFIRFETGFFPAPKGQPPLQQYVDVLPFIAVIVPLGFQLQGLYRLRRGRSRIDDFFNVLVGSIIAVVLGVVSTLYFQAYYVPDELKDRGAYEVSQGVWAAFLLLNVMAGFLSRMAVREALERRWVAGIGLRRILIAGAGDLGRMVADKMLEHRELGYQILGFVDDRAGGDHLGYRGLPLLGRLDEAAEIVRREKVDHLYVALPLEEHMKLLDLVESTSREGVDVRVVPDLLQFIALRARLEDLDGVPVINLNDVPLQGINAVIKRALDICISLVALITMALPGLVIAWLIKRSSPGPVFYRQERMGLDGKQFYVYKFRTMPVDAEADGPVWADQDDPRATPIGRWLRKRDLDEWPQFWNVLKGDMSMVGPRPSPEKENQFCPAWREARLSVRPGITGLWQIRRTRDRSGSDFQEWIKYDIEYVENMSIWLDLKIIYKTIEQIVRKGTRS